MMIMMRRVRLWQNFTMATLISGVSSFVEARKTRLTPSSPSRIDGNHHIPNDIFHPRGASHRSGRPLVLPRNARRRLDEEEEECGFEQMMRFVSCSPTSAPTPRPTNVPTRLPTSLPTSLPTYAPSLSREPSVSPTTAQPTFHPTTETPTLTFQPTARPTFVPTEVPSSKPSNRPSTAPSVSPSDVPTASPSYVPTDLPSFAPSTEPSAIPTASPSADPTIVPTSSPTAIPSSQPSSVPTVTPSASPSRSPTQIPSARPSASPSSTPTSYPSASPSSSPSARPSMHPTISTKPSASPTVSFAPTLDPFGVNVDVKLDENDNRAITTTCRPDIPGDADQVTTQLIQYEYILNVQNGTVVSVVLASIEETISNSLTQIFLDCRFGLVREFYVYSLNSAPNDRVAGGCLLAEQVPGATCYAIAGQMTTTFFYRNQDQVSQRTGGRLLQNSELVTQISDPNVADAFAAALENVFLQEGLGGENVVEKQFAGISNEVPPPPPPPPNRTPVIVGGVFGGALGAVLCVVAIFSLAKRQAKEAENQYYQQAMDAVDSEIDNMETIPADLQAPTAYIINDDDETTQSSDLPWLSGTALDAQSRAVEFIGTSENQVTPSEQDQERMLEKAKRELGPTAYEPRISRVYGMSDTVDL